jgi:hypothetical protein
MIRTWALFAVLISGALLQEPVLGAADSERRNCPGVRGVLSEVPEASMSAAGVTRLAIAVMHRSGDRHLTGHSLRDVNEKPRFITLLGGAVAEESIDFTTWTFRRRICATIGTRVPGLLWPVLVTFHR